MAGHSGSKHLTTTQIVAVVKLLETHIEKLEEGMCRYLNGKSDESIAAEIGALSKNGVVRIRQEMFGKLASSVVIKKEVASDEIEKLRRQIDHDLAVLIAAHNRLVDELSALFNTSTVTKLKIEKVHINGQGALI